MANKLISDVVIRTLEEDLADFDTVVVSTGDAKQEIADITMSALRRLSPTDLDVHNPDSVGNFAKLASAALKAVDARETTSMRRVQSKVKLSEVRRSDDAAAVVTDILIKMHEGSYTPDMTEKLPSLDGDSVAVDEKYLQLELPDIPDSVLRTDPDDVS